MKKDLLSYISNYHREESFCFKHNKMEISRFNAIVCITFSALLAAITLTLGIMFRFLRIVPTRLNDFYGYAFVISLAFFLVSILIVKWHIEFSTLLIYVFSIWAYVFAIILGYKILDGTQISVLFVCFQMIMPLLILDMTGRINLFVVIMLVINLVICQQNKPNVSFLYDALFGICCTVSSIFFGIIVRKYIFSSIEKSRLLGIRSNTDVLTGLPNRRSLFDQLAKSAAGKERKKVNAIIMIDIDWFKNYNDTYGHQAGDFCLQRLGQCFSDFAEKNEIAMYRYGGEEFTGIGYEITEAQLESYAHDLRAAVQDLAIPYPSSKEGVITISVGYVFKKSQVEQSYDLILQMADDALYQAKTKGRNCVCASKPM